MSEYVPGAAKALIEASREVERDELPDAADYRTGTITRTSRGRTWKCQRDGSGRPARWTEVVLIPKRELRSRTARKTALLAAAVIVGLWTFTVTSGPSAPFAWGILAAIALLFVWANQELNERDLVEAPTGLNAVARGALARVRESQADTVQAPEQETADAIAPTSVEVLAGGPVDDVDTRSSWSLRPTPGLPHRVEVEPGAVIDVDGVLWRRWGRSWTPVRRRVTAKQNRTAELVDVLLVAGGAVIALVPMLWGRHELSALVRTVLAGAGELALLTAIATTTLARHRAVLPRGGESDAH